MPWRDGRRQRGHGVERCRRRFGCRETRVKARARGYAGGEASLARRSRRNSRAVGPVYLERVEGVHEEVLLFLCDEVLVACGALFSEF